MSQSLEEALRNPTPTADKRVRAFTDRVRAMERRPLIPMKSAAALNVAALQRKYDPSLAHHPRIQTATFRVPVGCTPAHLHQLKLAALKKLIQALDKMGWEAVVDSQHPVQDQQGVYPARDLANNTQLLDQREWLIQAWFRFRNPQPQRIELLAEDVAPVAMTA